MAICLAFASDPRVVPGLSHFAFPYFAIKCSPSRAHILPLSGSTAEQTIAKTNESSWPAPRPTNHLDQLHNTRIANCKSL